MADNRRSRLITAGDARSPNRAMLRAVGFKDGDFDKPIIGVANGHSTMNPCNAGIQPLVDSAIDALSRAGAKPQMFGVPTVTDGIGMGTEAMKYSLVSREVIADAIETSVNGQAMDGVLVVGGCDKNMPGGMLAMARMNVPGIYVYGGTIKPGRWKGQDLTVVSVFEAVGAHALLGPIAVQMRDVAAQPCNRDLDAAHPRGQLFDARLQAILTGAQGAQVLNDQVGYFVGHG